MFLDGHHSQLVCPSCASRSHPAHWEHLGVSWGTCWKEGTPTGKVFRPGHRPCPSLRSCGEKGRSAALTARATSPRGPSGQMTRVPRPPRGPPPGPGRPAAVGSHCAPLHVLLSLRTREHLWKNLPEN